MKVDTHGPANAKIMLVGEAPGENEDREGKPFSPNGVAGKTLNWLLSQAGIDRSICLVTNVARVRPPQNRMDFYFRDKECTMPKPELEIWINELKQDIEMHNPNVIIGFGSYALWALTGEKTIGRFRGYTMESTLVPGQKVLCTYHPSNINREWKNYFPTIMDLKKAKFHSQSPKLPKDTRTIVYNASRTQMIQYCKDMLDNPEYEKIGLDIETIQPGCHISLIGLSHAPKYAISTWVVNGSPCYPENDEFELWFWVCKLLENKKVIMHNASFDAVVALFNHGIYVKNLYMDTLIAAHVVWPELPRDLGFLSSICLDVPSWKTLSKQYPSYYNANDIANTMGIANVLEAKIKELKLHETYNFEMRQLPVAEMLQINGTLIDKKKQSELIEQTQKIINDTGNELEKIFGRKINYRSSPQLSDLLYNELNLPIQYKRRKNKGDKQTITADKNALKKLERLAPDNPMFKLVLDHKKNLTLMNFVSVETSPEDKVHTSYNITGKKIDNKDIDDEGRKSFGRWSSSESIILPYGSGNLQNIPETAREMYIAPKGYRIITADYIQAEAVVVAYLSNDRKLISLFKDSFGMKGSERKKHKELDVHILKASELFGVSIDKVTPEMRKIGKIIRHARNYAMGPGTLSTNLGCSLNDAKILLQKDDVANPLLKLWQDSIIEELRQSRTLTNLFGRVHRFLERWGDTLFKSAYSFKPQSTVGDLMNRALVRIYEDDDLIDLLTIWLQLHDAGYFLTEDTDDKMYEAMYWIRHYMIEKIKVHYEEMIIDVDFKWGYNWKDLHEVDYVS
jgi:uracil-DNA glycosylase family 4